MRCIKRRGVRAEESLLVSVLAMAGVWLVIAPVAVVARRIGLVSHKPRAHDGANARPPLPCAGGLSVMGVTIAVIGVWGWMTQRSYEPWLGWVGVGTLVMLVLGACDDRRSLSVWKRLLVQMIVAWLLLRAGIRVSTVMLPPMLNDLATIVWLVLMANALNMLDVVDGLAGGVAAIASAGFAVAGYLTTNPTAMLLGSTLAGGLLGFLLVNFYPAKVYLGNHGSMAIGFLLGALALAISYAPMGREMALAAPLLILGVPLFDIAFVMVMRWKERRPVWRGSDDHLVLRLIHQGWSEPSVVLCMYGCSVIFASAGLSLILLNNVAGSFMLVLAVSVIGVVAAQAYRVSNDVRR